MYLNLDTITSLIPAWTSAINHDLTKLVRKSTAEDTNTSPHPASPYSRVELKAVLSPFISAPGSTRELHFRCSLSSQDVFLQLSLTKPLPSSDTDDHRESVESEQLYVIHLHQVSCRRMSDCVNPDETSRVVRNSDPRSPVCVDIRWIKDTIYLGIQSAVTRIVVNPLCLTPVQHNLSTRQWPVSIPTQSVTSTNSIHTNVGHTSATYPVSPVLDNAILIRVMYAVLLEPTQPDAVDSLMRHQLLRCRIQRSSFTPVGSASNDSDEAEKQKENADTLPDDNLLMVTSGVLLESKSWPAEPQSNSLADQSTPSQLCGHAILPLPKLDEVQSKSQHVLLIDFHAGQSLTDNWRCSPPVRSDARAKFMLILRAYLVSHEPPISEQQVHHTSSAILDQPHGLRNRILSPVCDSNACVTTDCSYVDSVLGAYSTKPVRVRCPTDSESVNSSSHATPPHSNTVGLSTEQLTHFMSPSLLADWKSDLYRRTSSCELSRTSSAEPEPTALSDRAESPMTQTSLPRKQLIMNSSRLTTHKLGELSDISSSAVALNPLPTQPSVSALPKSSFSHDNLADSHVDNLTGLSTKSRKKARWLSIRLPRSHKRELPHATPPSSDGQYVSEGSKNAPGSPVRFVIFGWFVTDSYL
ncbi:hypothetical protein AHF37_04266 [Paragonimus kellicotti]|nr:hypothetical protein AHF37_04266 [Paragonimus kellicotti]